jgi:ATP-dependent Clp protease ATP-binding subunit ClpA
MVMHNGDMFERFSGNARQAVVLAQEECRKLNHRWIGTEHVLLGMLSIPGSAAYRALAELGLDYEMARSDVEELVGRGDRAPTGHVPFTPRSKKVLELSLREALKLKHNYIGTAHILLAIVREGEGVAAQVLHKRVDDLDKIREAARAELGAGHERMVATPAARTPATEEVLRMAERLAGSAPVGSHHLLEALARSHRSMAGLVLSGLGVDADKIAAKVDTIEPESTSDVTPEMAAASKMLLRLVDDEVQLVLRDAEAVALVRQLTELVGGELTGGEPLTGQFVTLWTAVRDGLVALQHVLAPESASGESEPGRGAGRSILDRLRGRGFPRAPQD